MIIITLYYIRSGILKQGSVFCTEVMGWCLGFLVTGVGWGLVTGVVFVDFSNSTVETIL